MAGERPPAAADRAARRRRAAGEALVWLVGLGVLGHALRSALFLGRTTFIHDVLFWTYPVHHFVADNLLQGRLPYWNPFSHGGEPLYPLLLQLHMLDPVSLGALAVGSVFTTDLTTLFNWSRVACAVVASLGAYLFLRQWTEHWIVRVSLVPVLLWSSFVLTSFRQTGTNDMFISAPFAAYFLFRILHFEDLQWGNWVGLGIAVGVAWQSYYFVGLWLFFLFTLVGFAAFRPHALTQLWRARWLWRRAAVTGALAALMALPNAVVLRERGAYVFPPRLVDPDYAALAPLGGPLQAEPTPPAVEDRSIIMPYALVRYSGSFIRPFDFVLMTIPDAARPERPGSLTTARFGHPSELFIYLGLLVYGGTLLGLVAGRHELKRVWMLNLGGFGLVILGPIGGLHWLLYQVYPPLWFLRHTELLLNFFLLAVLYFYVLGANCVIESRAGSPLRDADTRGPSRAARCFAGARFVVFGYVIAIITLVLSSVPLLGNRWPSVAVGVFLWGALAFALRRQLGPSGLFWGVVATDVALVLTVRPDLLVVVSRVAAFFVLPLGILLVARRARPAFGLIVLILAGDLGQYLYASSVFWSERRPEHVTHIPARPAPPRFVNTRRPALNPTIAYGQSLRYVELATRIPSALSSVRLPRGTDFPSDELSLATVLEAPRWNSLLMLREYYALIHSGLPPAVLEELFGIRRPLIQFRARAEVDGDGRRLEALRRGGETAAIQALRSRVILAEAPAARPASPDHETRDAPFSFVLTGYDYTSIDLVVEAPSPGFLYYADGYDPAWRAAVDGRPARVIRANGNFKAIPLGSGRHAVRLAYDPVLFRGSLYVFFGAPLAAIVILALAAAVRSLRRRSAESPARCAPESAASPSASIRARNTGGA
jgi:hypothetical protein